MRYKFGDRETFLYCSVRKYKYRDTSLETEKHSYTVLQCPKIVIEIQETVRAQILNCTG